MALAKLGLSSKELLVTPPAKHRRSESAVTRLYSADSQATLVLGADTLEDTLEDTPSPEPIIVSSSEGTPPGSGSGETPSTGTTSTTASRTAASKSKAKKAGKKKKRQTKKMKKGKKKGNKKGKQEKTTKKNDKNEVKAKQEENGEQGKTDAKKAANQEKKPDHKEEGNKKGKTDESQIQEKNGGKREPHQDEKAKCEKTEDKDKEHTPPAVSPGPSGVDDALGLLGRATTRDLAHVASPKPHEPPKESVHADATAADDVSDEEHEPKDLGSSLKKPKRKRDKAAHARRMRFYRSLDSQNLKCACFFQAALF